MVRDLHGAPGRAGLSTGLWRAWGRADPIGEADRGGGHPQAEQGGGRFRRWASAVCAAPKMGPGSGVRGGVPAHGAPRRGGGGGRGRGDQGGVGGVRGILNEGGEACPKMADAFRRALAEREEGPLPVPECAAVEVGCEKTTVLGGPEARPELPTLLDAGVVEEKVCDRPAERATGPPGELPYKNTKVKV